MLKKIVLGIGAVLAVLLVIGFFLPWGYKVERSIVIEAPASKIFPYVNSFKEWRKWDPWTEADDTLKFTYKGESGVGHSETWSSESSGEGWIEIRESIPNQRVSMDMDFKQGPPPSSDIILDQIHRGKTNVTWTMVGENSMKPIGNYLGLMMEPWVGGMYEKGLSNLKTLVEETKDPSPSEVQPSDEAAAGGVKAKANEDDAADDQNEDAQEQQSGEENEGN